MKSLCDSNSKNKITPPQVLLMSIPLYFACIFLGLLLRSLAMYSEEPPSVAVQLLSAWLSLGVGANGLTYSVILYIIYWLQILEVKKVSMGARAPHSSLTRP